MEEKISEEDSKIYKISTNFVDSLFNKQKNKSQEKNYSKYNNRKNRVIKHKTNDLSAKINQNPPKIKQNISKDNINAKKSNLKIQTTGKKKINNNSKILFTETSINNTKLNDFSKSARQTKKEDIENENSHSSAFEIYKAKQESLKEKKIYEEKVKILKNHINALKKQELELNKKAEINKEKEKNKNKIKQDKFNMKQALLSLEIDKRNALEEKKRNIIKQKKENNKGLKVSQTKIIKEKKKNYKQAYKDKQNVEKKRIENNNKKEENYHMIIQKIKNDREKLKENNIKKKNDKINKMSDTYKMSYKNNINETERLKNELMMLEKMEDQCIENLKKTQDYIKNNNDNDENMRLNNYQKINFNEFDYNNYYNFNNSKKKAISVKRRNNHNLTNQNMENHDKSSSMPK